MSSLLLLGMYYLFFNYMSVFPFRRRISEKSSRLGEYWSEKIFPFRCGKLSGITVICGNWLETALSLGRVAVPLGDPGAVFAASAARLDAALRS